LFLVSAVLCCLLVSCAAQKHYRELSYPRLRDIAIPAVERITLDNGMKLFLLEDHELPLITVSGWIRTGSIYEPADKIGLADITGTVMRTGGTAARTGDDIDEELERIAASVETGIGLSYGSASMSVLKEDLDTGLSILADVLMNPAFREDKIELAKVEHRSAIARRNDDPGNITAREFRKLIYGPENPYARHTEYATIDNITRDDLMAFHKRFYHPNNVMLGIWGDFDTQEMIDRIRKAFGGWEKADADVPSLPEITYDVRPTVNVVQKDDVNQTNIRMGHIGGMRSDPEYFALILMNRILGQGFTSRLFKNVRSRKGLAYVVYGNYLAYYSIPGVFYLGCQTKSERTVEAIRAIMEEVQRITESEVTDEELALAKDEYLNSFVFNFDTRGEIVDRLMPYEYFGYPSDFLEKTKANVEKVTKADILSAARERLHPDQLQILAVGRPQDFDESLSVLGAVREIDITIPVAREEAPEATTETILKGRELLNKAVDACGGAEAFAAIRNLVRTSDVTLTTPQGEMQIAATTTFLLPDKLHQVMVLPMGEMKQVVVENEGWMVTPQGTMDMPESQRQEAQASMFRDWVNLLRMSSTGALDVQYLGPGEVDGASAEVLSVTDERGNTVKLFLDVETFIPLKQVFTGMTMAGPADVEEIYSDLRDVSGIKYPFLTTSNAGDIRSVTAITDVKPNADIAPSIFERP